MFSDHLPKTNKFSVRTVLLTAAGVVFVCQVAGMVLVANGQVERAQLRDISQASAIASAVGCIESSRGQALRDCDHAPSSPLAALGAGDPAATASREINFVTISSRY